MCRRTSAVCTPKITLWALFIVSVERTSCETFAWCTLSWILNHWALSAGASWAFCAKMRTALFNPFYISWAPIDVLWYWQCPDDAWKVFSDPDLIASAFNILALHLKRPKRIFINPEKDSSLISDLALSKTDMHKVPSIHAELIVNVVITIQKLNSEVLCGQSYPKLILLLNHWLQQRAYPTSRLPLPE